MTTSTYFIDEVREHFEQLHPKKELPYLAYMTGNRSIDITLKVIEQLPSATLIIFRFYNHPSRLRLFKRIQAHAKKHHHYLLFAGTIEQAQLLNADGVHLNRHNSKSSLKGNIKQHHHLLISRSCHSSEELKKMNHTNTDFAFISPLFKTTSHPDGKILTQKPLQPLLDHAKIPLFALGGINRVTFHANKLLLSHHSFCGIGAISAIEQLIEA